MGKVIRPRSYSGNAHLEQADVLYIDGLVRVYHGDQTRLPRHHVARQKICLRATTDYWVNAMDGQPFMLVNQAVDPGLIKAIENSILPELDARLPPQVWPQATVAITPHPHRFTLVFDREGYSPDWMARLKAKQIAVITYRKYRSDAWPKTEFHEHTHLADGGRNARQTRRAGCLFK